MSHADPNNCKMSLDSLLRKLRGYEYERPHECHAVDDSATIRVNQSSDESPRPVAHNRFLPVGEENRSFVLPAGPVLRKQTDPVLGGRVHLRAALARNPSDRALGDNGLHSRGTPG